MSFIDCWGEMWRDLLFVFLWVPRSGTLSSLSSVFMSVFLSLSLFFFSLVCLPFSCWIEI